MEQAQPSLQVARWAGAHSGRGGGSHPFTPRTVCRGDPPLNEPDRNRAWSERSAPPTVRVHLNRSGGFVLVKNDFS